jgi:hypothetical protein
MIINKGVFVFVFCVLCLGLLRAAFAMVGVGCGVPPAWVRSRVDDQTSNHEQLAAKEADWAVPGH